MHEVELAAAAAWPAGRTEVVAGWLLRHTPGVARRRSNSALPPPADRHPERELDAVEAFYRAAGLPVTVQVSPAEGHGVLDAALAARGYRREAPTLVLTAPTMILTHATDPPGRDLPVGSPGRGRLPRAAPGGSTSPAHPAGGPVVEIDAVAGDRWLAAYQALNGPADTSAVAERVLTRVPAPAAFARAVVDGEDAAIGMFVAAGPRLGSPPPGSPPLGSPPPGGPAPGGPVPGSRPPGGSPHAGPWAGVFCMATAPRYRRRGLALAVLAAGARWAAAAGCAGLYLQVEQDNIAARDLYARAGFTHSHAYHYRVADTGPR
jgi:GNAT superfamily N-acetyltransferase